MKALRTAFYFCQYCVNENIDTHGQSYWRRQHQLSGQVLCTKHGCGLCYVVSDKALLKPPSLFLETAFQTGNEWVQTAMENPFYQRFFNIWISLAECEQSIYTGVASRVFRQKARELGFATRPGQADRPLLSDRIVELFGAQWLTTVCPSLASKSFGVVFPNIDMRILAQNGKSLAYYYVLIAALLFDTADEALFALVAAQPYGLDHTSGVE